MRSIVISMAVASACILAGHARAAGESAAAPAVVQAPTARARGQVMGTWRAAVRLPGGDAPFLLDIAGSDAAPVAVAHNAGEKVPFSLLEVTGSQVVLGFAYSDAVIRARLTPDGQRMEGWLHLHPQGAAGKGRLPFAATRGATPRFAPVSASAAVPVPAARAAVPSAAGTWSVTFESQDDSYDGFAELTDRGSGVITGTFVTPSGDLRYLEGSYESGILRLSGVDGARAALFHGRARKDGTLEGDVWLNDDHHAVWSAERSTAKRALPDPSAEVQVLNPERKLRLSMPDLAGRPVSLDDARFAGKVVIVDIFGTWCPNCADQAPLLVDWHRRYRARGLEIVGVSFELTGDPEHDRRVVRRFQERFGIEFPLLLSDAEDASEVADALPDLSAIKAYPTTILIGRDGTVRHIHSGFVGPSAGRHYEQQRAAFEARIEALLAERK
jgi:peroxiredoxin